LACCAALIRSKRWRFGERTGWAHRRQLGFVRRAAPSAATLHRALRNVDVHELERSLGVWQQQIRTAWYTSSRRWLDGIALDGKTCAALNAGAPFSARSPSAMPRTSSAASAHPRASAGRR
jgi:hypothetical protein